MWKFHINMNNFVFNLAKYVYTYYNHNIKFGWRDDMKNYKDLSKNELISLRKQVQERYDAFKAKDLKLDMSRGKPDSDQLDLSIGMMDCIGSDDIMQSSNGFDCRNYGVLDGIPEAKDRKSVV